MQTAQLAEKIRQRFADQVEAVIEKDMVTVELSPEHLLSVCSALRDDNDFQFAELIDLCGVDYHQYGVSEWRGEQTTATGFSRGVVDQNHLPKSTWDKPRYGVVYHLLSLQHNVRIRLKMYLREEPMCPSVIDVWNCANWLEREAFDLFGIVFDGHPDLRRILTDYGFKGHPFRKDFPLIGEVELRYDAATQRCVYEPVSIQPRVLVPKVIRDDARYSHADNEEGADHG